MIHSLRFRLLISFLVVILITVGTVSFFVARSSWDQIRQYEENTNQVRTARAVSLISGFYASNGNWNGIQELIETLATMEQRRIIITDVNNIVIADSQNVLQGKEYHQNDDWIQLYKRSFGTPSGPQRGQPNQADLIATLYVSPLTSTVTSLIRSINGFLLI